MIKNLFIILFTLLFNHTFAQIQTWGNFKDDDIDHPFKYSYESPTDD